MAGGGKLKLKLPEKELRQIVKRYGPDALQPVGETFAEGADEALGKMIQIAPVDTGALESSGSVRTNTSPGRRVSRADFRFDTPYAGIVHEMPEYARGPGTRAKGGNEFGPAGPKYIERVLRGFKIGPRIAEALRAYWRGAGRVR
jgi:hypothetical protein